MKLQFSIFIKSLPILLSLGSLTIIIVKGQRTKEEGCYFDSPASFICPPDAESLALSPPFGQQDDDDDAEEVCGRLAVEVFPSEDSYVDTTLHAEYLNAIDASDAFCQQVRQAYTHCTFCASHSFRLETQVNWYRTKCGGNQPTLEQVLGDNSTAIAAAFHTAEDVQATCQELQSVYNSPAQYPRSIRLAQQQNRVKHLCLGQCHNGCFDPQTYPTSCDPKTYQGLVYDNLDIGPICDFINSYLYYWLDDDQQRRNVSSHAEYLRAIPGNTTDCDWARQAYYQCSWCSSDNTNTETGMDSTATTTTTTLLGDEQLGTTPTKSCFDPIFHPAICDELNQDDYATFQNVTLLQQVNYVCAQLTQNLVDENYLIYPVPLHTQKLTFAANTPFCDSARRYYKLCYWCAPEFQVPVQVPADNSTMTNNTVTANNAAIFNPIMEPEPMHSCNQNKWCSYDTQNNNNSDEDDIVYQYPFLYEPHDGNLLTVDPSTLTATTTMDCDATYQRWASHFYFRYTYPACFQDIILHHVCRDTFCANKTSDIDYTTYLGASTTSQKKALVWMSRAASFLSFGGASFILYDIILANPKARATVYHQLLLGMAIFDIITAIAWCFATAPMDAEQAWWLYGAIGTQATCKTQGFFIQLGLTSIFYNVSLAGYYVLVIAYGWRETRLQQIRPWMHGIPVVVGLGLALGGIPLYQFMSYSCHILPPPDGRLWQSLLFVVIPLGLSIVAITASMFVVYWKVRQQAKAAQKWTMGGRGRSNSMERDVFWQCCFYVLAFYVTWPILFAVYLASVDVNGPFGLTMTIAFVAPLQGFSNFLVFIRPKFFKRTLQGNNRSSYSATSHSGFFGDWSSKRDSLYAMMRSMNFMAGSARDGSGSSRFRLNSSLFSSSIREEETSPPDNHHHHHQEQQPEVSPVEENGAENENQYYEMDPSALIAQDDNVPDSNITMLQAQEQARVNADNRLEPVMEEIPLDEDDTTTDKGPRESFLEEDASMREGTDNAVKGQQETEERDHCFLDEEGQREVFVQEESHAAF